MKYIAEYKEYWFDCDVEYEEQTILIKSNSKELATKLATKKLKEMDGSDNKFLDPMQPMVSRRLYRVVELDKHRFNSSTKFPILNGFEGHMDITKL